MQRVLGLAVVVLGACGGDGDSRVELINSDTSTIAETIEPTTDTAPATDSEPATDTAPATDSEPATDSAQPADSAPATDSAQPTDSAPATDTVPPSDVVEPVCYTLPVTEAYQPQRLDLVIAVDTSGSMDDEVEGVEDHLADLAQQLAQLTPDVHVILIADSSICIGSPLGSGSCNGQDSRLPSYRHVQQGVGSHTALEVMLSTYPQWSASIRDDAESLFLVVSDDDSDMGADTFTESLLALDPPRFERFIFSAVAAPTAPDLCINQCFFTCGSCTNPCCDQANNCAPLQASEGTVYRTLAQQTGGTFADLCQQNFDLLFYSIAEAVGPRLTPPCTYTLPDRPAGTPEATLALELDDAFLIESTKDDCGDRLAWYAGAPGSITLCPAACEAGGTLEVYYGCASPEP